MLERERELVDRLLEHRRALHHPGARNAFCGAQVRLGGERERAHVGAAVERAGGDEGGHLPSRPAPSRPPRRPRSRSACRRAVAPRRTVCRVAPRRPPSSCSAWRSLTSRTGRPVIRASSAAASASKPAPCLPPKPPPTNSVRTRTSSLRSPNAAASSSRAENIPCVETQAVSWSPSHEATARVRLERRLQLRRRLELELDRHLGGRERRLGVAPGIVGRLADEALLVDGLAAGRRCGRAPRCRARARGRPPAPPRACRPRRPRSAGRRSRARPRGAARASSATARSRARSPPAHPEPRSAASRSSERTRPCATGERSTAAWSIPASRTSTV